MIKRIILVLCAISMFFFGLTVTASEAQMIELNLVPVQDACVGQHPDDLNKNIRPMYVYGYGPNSSSDRRNIRERYTLFQLDLSDIEIDYTKDTILYFWAHPAQAEAVGELCLINFKNDEAQYWTGDTTTVTKERPNTITYANSFANGGNLSIGTSIDTFNITKNMEYDASKVEYGFTGWGKVGINVGSALQAYQESNPGIEQITFMLKMHSSSWESTTQNQLRHFVVMPISSVSSYRPYLQVTSTPPQKLLWRDADTHSMGFQPKNNYYSMQNPPDFTWTYVEKNATYDLIVATDEGMQNVVYEARDIPQNVYNFPYAFETDQVYYWAVRYKLPNGSGSVYSAPLRFYIGKDATKYTIPAMDDLMETITQKVTPDNFKEKLTSLKGITKDLNNSDYPAYKRFYDGAIKNINSNLSNNYPLPTRERVANYWTPMLYKEFPQRIVSMALLAYITDNETYWQKSVEELNRIRNIDPKECFDFNATYDTVEAIFAYQAAIAYLLLYDHLTPEQRENTVSLIERHLERPFAGFYKNGEVDGIYDIPFNSHAWRMNQTMMASILIYNHSEDAKKVVKAHLPLFACMPYAYSYQDGGSTQGTFYGTNLELFEIVYFLKMLDVLDMTSKAYISNSAYNLLYSWPQGWVTMNGDTYRYAPEEENPSYEQFQHKTKTQYFALNANSSAMQQANKWLLEQVTDAEQYFHSNYIMNLMLASKMSEIEGRPPSKMPQAKWFWDTGFVSMFSGLDGLFSERIGLTFTSAPNGSENHAHPDQNSFVIQAFGETLAIDSGAYDYYYSPFDLSWSKRTYAHNTITMDGGKGQPHADIRAKGNITSFVNHPDFDLAVGDATKAYYEQFRPDRPYVNKAKRQVIYLKPDVYVMIDDLKSDVNRSYEWWLNVNGELSNVTNNSALVSKGAARLNVNLYSTPALTANPILNQFAGPPGSDAVTGIPSALESDPDSRVYYSTASTKEAKIIAVMDVHKENNENKSFTMNETDSYFKLTAEDGSILFINKGITPCVAEQISFDGEALVVRNDSYMLINGKKLTVDGTVLIEAQQIISGAVGKSKISISAIEEDSQVRVYLPRLQKVSKLVDEYKYEIPKSQSGEMTNGIAWTTQEDYGEFNLYNGAYSLETASSDQHLITLSKTEGGSVTYSGDLLVTDGETKRFTILPDVGYYIKKITFDGAPVIVNFSGAYETPFIRNNGELVVEFAVGIPGAISYAHTYKTTNEQGYPGNISFGIIDSFGFSIKEYGIIFSTDKGPYTLWDVNHKTIRQFKGMIISPDGKFGIELIDKTDIGLLDNYYFRAYAVINVNGTEEIYYGDEIFALMN